MPFKSSRPCLEADLERGFTNKSVIIQALEGPSFEVQE